MMWICGSGVHHQSLMGKLRATFRSQFSSSIMGSGNQIQMNNVCVACTYLPKKPGSGYYFKIGKSLRELGIIQNIALY